MLRTKVPVRYKNPHASSDMMLDVEIIENTPPKELAEHTRHNASVYDNWLQAKEAHATPAVLIGGGPSINDHIDDIKRLKKDGATIFAMNGSSKWAHDHGIEVDAQIILDAKEETSTLVDGFAANHYFSSQCHPKTTGSVGNVTIWHLARPDIELLFPPEKVKRGGYVIVGGDSTVGICALCLVYTQGYRKLHCFGYDTSYKDKQGHGYIQDVNKTMPSIPITWDGVDYTISIAMKDQVGNFLSYSTALEKIGCEFEVYGDGLLQSVYRSDPSTLSEQDKYRLMWMFSSYRMVSPGEANVDFYIDKFKPVGRIIDFGCGTGKAGIKFSEAGYSVTLIDFADNCRDNKAMDLPFIEWDLTEEMPFTAENGFCTDVMEHIPTEDVDKVIRNIMTSAEKVFFQISTEDDALGGFIDCTLHNTIKPYEWWYSKFVSNGYNVVWSDEHAIAALFYISNPDRRETWQ